jgi:hypothetical protein
MINITRMISNTTPPAAAPIIAKQIYETVRGILP